MSRIPDGSHVYYRDSDQTPSLSSLSLSLSLRWICSLESWCLTSSCLETASPTSLKSSERGELISLKPSAHTHRQTHTDTHTHTNIHTCHLLINPQGSWLDLTATLCFIWIPTRCQTQTRGSNALMVSGVTHIVVHLCFAYTKKKRHTIQFGNKTARHLPRPVALWILSSITIAPMNTGFPSIVRVIGERPWIWRSMEHGNLIIHCKHRDYVD